jgi:hypothetical protein
MTQWQKVLKLKMKEVKQDPGVAAAGIMSSEKLGMKTGGGNQWKGKRRNVRIDTKVELLSKSFAPHDMAKCHAVTG